MTTHTRGRKPGLLLNPDAFADSVDGRSQAYIANAAGLSTAHLSEMLSGRKAATDEVAVRLAAALDKRVGTLFPERAQFRTQIRHFVAPSCEAVA